MRGLSIRSPASALLLILVSLPARAQDNYEIQVYSAETVKPHETMVELHSNFTVEGRTSTTDGLRPTNHALHETLEITHGFTPWFEVGYYNFTPAHSGDGWDWVGIHLRPRVRVPDSLHWPIGLSWSNEVGYQRRPSPVDSWTWETPHH